MKKILALFLAVILAMSAAAVVSADETSDYTAFKDYCLSLLKVSKPDATEADINIDIFEKIVDQKYIARCYFAGASGDESDGDEQIGDYVYYASSSADDVCVFDAAKSKTYSLFSLYEKGVLSDADLDTVAAALKDKPRIKFEKGKATYTTSDGRYDYYMVNGNEVCIKKYLGSDNKVVIPEKIYGLKVTRIGESAFYKSSVKSITIPKTIRRICKGAIKECQSLTSLKITGSSKLVIESKAFSSNHYLKTADLPQYNEKKSGTGFFYLCVRLGKVNISNKVKAIPGYCFYYCRSLKSAKLPASVKTIGERAFMSCQKLSKYTVPSTVKKIGEKAIGYKRTGDYYEEIRDKSFVIRCAKNSAAYKYAKANKLKAETK